MNNLYEQVYWITLRHRKDRQQFFGKNLAEFGHEPTIKVLAIDPEKLNIINDPAAMVTLRTMGNNRMIGSYLSHLFVMKLLAMNPKDTLVLEDDAELCQNFAARLQAAMLAIPADWEVVHLGGYRDDRTPEDGCWAYLIRGSAAEKVEQILESRSLSVDDTFKQMRDQQKVRFYHVANPLVRHACTDLVTDISIPIYLRNRKLLDKNPVLSFSQYGEDLFVDDFFGKTTGRFLEIGAMDGVKDSNCHRLSLKKWRGVCVEPNPHIFVRLLETYRPHPEMPEVHCLSALVLGENLIRTLHLNFDGLTTSSGEMFKEMHQRVVYYGHCHAATVTPLQLYQTYGGDFDFVSVDAEGTDLDILRAPYAKELLAGTRLICVEKDLPGRAHDEVYTQALKDALKEIGLGTQVHETPGNILFAR